MKDYHAKKEIASKKFEKKIAQLEALGFEIPEVPETKVGITRKSREEPKYKKISRKKVLKAKYSAKRVSQRRSKKSLKKGQK